MKLHNFWKHMINALAAINIGSRQINILLAGLLFIIGIVGLMPLMHYCLGGYDEGIILCGAMRVCRGDLPYKDFWTSYAPGQFYAVGSLFSLFGESSLVLRIYDILIRSAIAATCFVLVRQFLPLLSSLLCYLAVLVWLFVFDLPGYPVYPAVLFSLLAILALVRGLGRTSATVFLSGLFAGIVTVFRHDMGFMIIATLSTAIVLFASHSSHYLKDPIIRFREALTFLLAALTPIFCVFGYMVLAAGFLNVFDQLVVFPLRVFNDYRGLPYPDLLKGSVYSHHWRWDLIYHKTFFILPVCILAGILCSSFLLTRRRQLMKGEKLIILLSFAGAAFIPQALGRSDFWHLLPIGIVSIVLSFQFSILSRKRLATWSLITIATAFYLLPCKDYRPIMHGVAAPVTSDQWSILTLLKKLSPDEPIYVGVRNHDRMTANEPLLYFLAGGRFGSRYHELHPGVITTESVQRSIIEDLQRNKVRFIILTEGFWLEPNKSQADYAINLLDDYISRSYSLVFQTGEYLLLKKNDVN